ncbi:Exonuclease RNase T and DNA polymerase III [Actinobacteria bacterium OK074]|nr:Exonuclease RNase T and DNA polymerase III [Actinobacteria bacterium OK074]
MSSWHTTRMAALHLHTTGLDPDTARIVLADVVLVGGSQPVNVRTWLVNPGVPIPEQATRVHGITTDQAAANGEHPAAALSAITDHLTDAVQQGAPLVVFRAPYALTVLDRECRRHGLPTLDDRLAGGVRPVIDPLVLDKQTDRFRRGSRTLRDLCRHHQVRHDGDHGTASDAVAAARLAWRLGHANPALGELPLDALHDRQVAWSAEQAASLQEHRRRSDPGAVIDGSWPVVPGRRG